MRFFASCLLLLAVGPARAQCAKKVPVAQAVARAEAQYAGYLRQYPDSTLHPRSIGADGTLHRTTSRNWTSGFFAGNLWYLAALSGHPRWQRPAAAFTETLAPEQFVTTTHDLGFILNDSYGLGYAQTQDPAYKAVIIQGARSLATRFSPTVGAIRSWDHNAQKWAYPVIVDNLMNLEMLFAASQLSGDTTFAHIAKAHANTDMRYRFRPDGSTFHVLGFDPATGQLSRAGTHQGYADGTCWARGQGWAIYGYTMLYRETGDPRYLATARRAADYFLTQTARIADHIPYWDFNDPGIPNVPRDASAAAVAASGLLELSKYVPKKAGKAYCQEATTMLRSLCSPAYLAEAGTNNFYLLKHSTGNMPEKSEIDAPLVYADYYFLEALWRYQHYDDLPAALKRS